MLLIDGVKYNLWLPKDEVKDFHPIIKEHSKEIFGESSEFFDGSKLSSIHGINRIPDGIVIIFGDSPCWHIVEIELARHDIHKHIVPQVTDFITAMNSHETRQRITEKINYVIKENDFLKPKVRKIIEPEEIHEFLTNVIKKPPILSVIIDDDTSKVEEILDRFRNHPDISDIKIIHFQTFTRENLGLSVHAHFFEPVYSLESVDERVVGWPDGEYELVYIEGEYEVYKNLMNGELSIKKLFPGREEIARDMSSLQEAKKWTSNSIQQYPDKNDVVKKIIEFTLTNEDLNYERLEPSESDLSIFPPIKFSRGKNKEMTDPFVLVTDFGIYQPYITKTKDGYRIRKMQGWFREHEKKSALNKGDKLIIEVIEPMKKYRLKKA